VANTGYALAATTLGSNGTEGVDVYALSSTSRLLVARRTAQGEMQSTFSDLGDDGEYAWRSGGLAATPVIHPGTGLSHAFYIGNIQSANRLYRRSGDPDVALDADPRGHLHLAYMLAGERLECPCVLRYATNRSGEWESRTSGGRSCPSRAPCR
jgi:hypothetical protein